MQQASRLWLTCLVASLMLACKGVPVGPTTKRSPQATSQPAPTIGSSPAPLVPLIPPPPETPLQPPPPTAPGVAPIISDKGASLSGRILAPASILANNGSNILSNNSGNLISDHGGGVLSNNGGNYRLLGVLSDQVPVGGTTVRLVDAAGRPARDAAGKPLTTVSAADGSYTFTGAPGDKNLLVTTDLKDGSQLAAFVPRGAGARSVDLDLVATLTTGYIYAQYVAWQADPVATLEKLPGDVEATTRTAAAAAFVASGEPVPARLGRGEVAASVQRMRSADLAFDRQMAAVRELLIVAGLSDLGNGKPAVEVDLGIFHALAFSPEGELYVSSQGGRRIWRVLADGILASVVGGNTATNDLLDGQRGTQAGVGQVLSFNFDTRGRLVFVDRLPSGGVRVTRLELDGSLRELWRPAADGSQVLAVAPDDGDGLYALVGHFSKGSYLTHVTGGVAGDPQPPTGLGAGDLASMLNVGDAAVSMARDAQGRLVLIAPTQAGYFGVFRFDPVTRAASRLAPAVNTEAMMDAKGRAYGYDRPGSAIVGLADDGTTSPLLSLAHPNILPATNHMLGVDRDGAIYLQRLEAGKGAMYRYPAAGGVATRVAGVLGETGGNAGSLALGQPTELLPLADGNMLVVNTEHFLNLAADSTVTPIAGTSVVGPKVDGALATETRLSSPNHLSRDAAGTLYWVENYNTIHTIAPDGKYHELRTTEFYLESLAAAQDGTLYYNVNNDVWRLSPGAADPVKLFSYPATQGQAFISMVFDPAGRLWVQKNQALMRLAGDGTPTHLAFPAGGRLVSVDATGRCYYVLPDAVVRFDPTTRVTEKIAGPGGRLFTGTGVDDSLLNPGAAVLDSKGDLIIADTGHSQIKRVPAAKL